MSAAKLPRILLSSVFGPYGVDDAYGRKENIMELFHNQVTKAQGISSLRFHHRSFGLYFIAANINADVTVLDFPSRKRFISEIKSGNYDIIGISFIAPNFVKAQDMAKLIRRHAPRAKIIVGGHGAAVENVGELIDCDYVARGEGIRWMREFLGQDPEAPIYHPSLPSSDKEIVLGAPVPDEYSSLLVPGVGCVNGCSFCCTSHYFGRAYTPFIKTGQELFEVACRIADERGTNTFFVMDENFLKDKARALELLAQMEKHKRFFRFHIFSSAEAITAFGVDNMVRLGVSFVWMGVECSSPTANFEKNRGIDPRVLIKQLRDRGIAVLASGILCMEHHTPENMQQDIDFLVGLQADFVQFMLLTPMPVTGLYQSQKARGLLRTELPYEEWHGQKYLIYYHPLFPGDEPERWINRAFRQDYEVNSSSIFRAMETSWRGYKYLASLTNRDACLEERFKQLKAQTRDYSVMLPALSRHAVNGIERRRVTQMLARVDQEFGPPTLKEKLMRAALIPIAASWAWRVALFGDQLQPSTILTKFKRGRCQVCQVSDKTTMLDQLSTASAKIDAAARIQEVA